MKLRRRESPLDVLSKIERDHEVASHELTRKLSAGVLSPPQRRPWWRRWPFR